MSQASGPYLQVWVALLRHRKTLRLAALLGLSRHAAVGLLLDLWAWGLGNATAEGMIKTCLAAELALAVDWKGSAEDLETALALSGFIERQNGGLLLHEWSLYGGRTQVALERERERARANYMKRKGKCTGRSSSSAPANGRAGEGLSTECLRVDYAVDYGVEYDIQEVTVKTTEGRTKRRPTRRSSSPVQLVRDNPPTAEQVQVYLDELGERRFTGQAFVDQNTSTGWVQGKAGKPLVDWKACVRTWRRMRDEWGQESGEAVVVEEDERATRNRAYVQELIDYAGDPLLPEYKKLVTSGRVPLGFAQWKKERLSCE